MWYQRFPSATQPWMPFIPQEKPLTTGSAIETEGSRKTPFSGRGSRTGHHYGGRSPARFQHRHRKGCTLALGRIRGFHTVRLLVRGEAVSSALAPAVILASHDSAVGCAHRTVRFCSDPIPRLASNLVCSGIHRRGRPLLSYPRQAGSSWVAQTSAFLMSATRMK